MVWIARPLGEGLCYHVRVQCNNREFRFASTEDFERYLNLLTRLKGKLGFYLHHFVLMHTHVHLIISTPGPVLLNRIMQQINHQYAVDYHRRHLRSGHFWINAYRCSIIDTDNYALTCMRYLDRNPVRAGIVGHPQEWPWSAYRCYAEGLELPLINTHPSFLQIADTQEARQREYRRFVEKLLPSDEVREKEWINQALRCYGTRQSK